MIQKLVKLTIAGILLLLLVFLMNALNLSIPLHMTASNVSSELSVVGEGKVEVVPDTAYVDAGISVVEASSVAQVQKTIDDANNKIIAAMKALGIDKKDVKTSNYSINPNYSYENNKNGITGYNGNATITITVKNTSLVSKVIEEATKAGANQVNGARFTVEDPAKYREEARTKAIDNAKEQANKLANSLGIKLGKVTNIVESSGEGVPPIMYAKSMNAGMGGGIADSAQIEPGSQTITSTVTLFFEKR